MTQRPAPRPTCLRRRLVAAVVAVVVALITIAVGLIRPDPTLAQAPGDEPDRIAIAEPGVEGSVVRLYRAALGRAPDADGLNFWVWRYIRGEPLLTIAAGFATSPEFTSTYGDLTDTEFVEQVYTNVLGRSADPDGAEFWIGRLATGASRPDVLVGIAESVENQQRTATAPPSAPSPPTGTEVTAAAVTRLYQATFLRAPDRDGMRHWVAQRSEGVPLIDIATAFAGSAEFVARYGALDDVGFVELIYANVLGRPADAEGRAFWSRIAATDGRGAVLDGLAQSDEFADRTGTPRIVDDPIVSPSRPLPDRVLVIGDSVLEGLRLTGFELGAESTHYDTEVGRQITVLDERIERARDGGTLEPVIVIHLGTNGWPSGSESLLNSALSALSGHEVVLVDVHAARSWTAVANAAIHRSAERFDHVRLVRWSVIATADGNVGSDGIHPSARGRAALATAITDLLRTSP